jgi:hypothetical protein
MSLFNNNFPFISNGIQDKIDYDQECAAVQNKVQEACAKGGYYCTLNSTANYTSYERLLFSSVPSFPSILVKEKRLVCLNQTTVEFCPTGY